MSNIGSAKGEARKRKAAESSIMPEAPRTQEEKHAIIKALSAKINKSTGREMIFVAGDKPEFGVVTRISSDIYSIDKLTGGGLPRGRVTEIFGAESVGKTTLALRFIAQTQRIGGVAVYIDAEWSFDKSWAEVNGVDISKLWVITPTTCEEALQGLWDVCKHGAADIVVLDSVVALATVHEKNRQLTDDSIGVMARKLSQFFRTATSDIARSNAAVIMTNQVRVSINSYGSPEEGPGGHALKHYKALSILMRRAATGKPDESYFYVKVAGKNKQIGFPMAFRVKKNKIGDAISNAGSSPGSEAMVDFYFGVGFDVKADLIDAAIELELPCITKSGTWFTFQPPEGDPVKEQGRFNFIDSLKEEHLDYIKSQMRDPQKEEETQDVAEA